MHSVYQWWIAVLLYFYYNLYKKVVGYQSLCLSSTNPTFTIDIPTNSVPHTDIAYPDPSTSGLFVHITFTVLNMAHDACLCGFENDDMMTT